ncbi:hypothetical protein E2562_014942 [Oryza meyeriana var. granulata]|uniref:Uncharacterized protein n=1 Tax=Oryza meyeriana var. granulata TaxID=110450 RepID=A0A6G1EJT2_9ORYZ|nr:hypothetical protein E2562_014942 [Oryza meyeriana var. granulata]
MQLVTGERAGRSIDGQVKARPGPGLARPPVVQGGGTNLLHCRRARHARGAAVAVDRRAPGPPLSAIATYGVPSAVDIDRPDIDRYGGYVPLPTAELPPALPTADLMVRIDWSVVRRNIRTHRSGQAVSGHGAPRPVEIIMKANADDYGRERGSTSHGGSAHPSMHAALYS